ncbi:glutathione S-transferase family protein [Ruegeria lacuscaerulensis]|uniref:glutathione S-transferase family protein n=1 Tax=Ruegeria lacuscaerulensis TaxID=55218 RepID=UPI00147CBA6D|nr:glutathione S-transferase [Ruegeria lacuscaerulensis]
MKLCSAPGTCTTAVHITLEWIGQPYEVEHLDYAAMKTPAYLKLNPSVVVPTLVDEGRALSEASAVLVYRVDRFPNAGIGPATGSEERVKLNQWLLFLSATLHPYFWPYFSPGRFTTSEADHAHVVEASQLLVDKALTRIDQHLDGKS